MLLAPQLQKQRGVEAGQLVPAMDGGVAAPAQGDVQGRAVVAGAPVVDQQPCFGQAQLAAAVAGQHRFAMSAKKLRGAPPPVVAGPAEAVGDERRATAGAAPPGGLCLRELHPALPRVPEPHSGRIAQ